MRFAVIDIGGERHAIAVVNDNGTLTVKSTLFGEEAVGYERLRELLGCFRRLSAHVRVVRDSPSRKLRPRSIHSISATENARSSVRGGIIRRVYS
jgi:hypothetical protein